jgi:hypothetical protein
MNKFKHNTKHVFALLVIGFFVFSLVNNRIVDNGITGMTTTDTTINIRDGKHDLFLIRFDRTIVEGKTVQKEKIYGWINPDDPKGLVYEDSEGALIQDDDKLLKKDDYNLPREGYDVIKFTKNTRGHYSPEFKTIDDQKSYYMNDLDVKQGDSPDVVNEIANQIQTKIEGQQELEQKPELEDLLPKKAPPLQTEEIDTEPKKPTDWSWINEGGFDSLATLLWGENDAFFIIENDPLLGEWINALSSPTGTASKICRDQMLLDLPNDGSTATSGTLGGPSAHIEAEIIITKNWSIGTTDNDLYYYTITFEVDPGQGEQACDMKFRVYLKEEGGDEEDELPLIVDSDDNDYWWDLDREDEDDFSKVSYIGNNIIFQDSVTLYDQACIEFDDIDPENRCLPGIENGNELCSKIQQYSEQSNDFDDGWSDHWFTNLITLGQGDSGDSNGGSSGGSSNSNSDDGPVVNDI